MIRAASAHAFAISREKIDTPSAKRAALAHCAHEHFATVVIRSFLLNPARQYAGVNATAFLASYSSSRTVVAGLHPRFGRVLCSLLRTAAATLGAGVSRDWFPFTDSCSPVRERPGLFWRLFNYVGGFPALPDDADLALGVGLERPGTCGGACAYQYWNGGNLQVQDREANFPGDLGRVSKGS